MRGKGIYLQNDKAFKKNMIRSERTSNKWVWKGAKGRNGMRSGGCHGHGGACSHLGLLAAVMMGDGIGMGMGAAMVKEKAVVVGDGGREVGGVPWLQLEVAKKTDDGMAVPIPNRTV